MDALVCLLPVGLIVMPLMGLFAYALCATASGADAHIVRYISEKESNAKDSGR